MLVTAVSSSVIQRKKYISRACLNIISALTLAYSDIYFRTAYGIASLKLIDNEIRKETGSANHKG